MIPVRIQTLIVTAAPAPSIIVLQPVEETQNGKSRVVPIWIGAAEAAQMGVALEKARFTRPTTHDLFLDALTNLDARVDHVVINDVKGPTFFARLALRQGGRLIELDARPSDALFAGRASGSPHLHRGQRAGTGFIPVPVQEGSGRGKEEASRSFARSWRNWRPKTSRSNVRGR